MNMLRVRPLVHVVRTAAAARATPAVRTYASGRFVPPRSMETIHDTVLEEAPRTKPESKTFYTGRSIFYDALRQLEEARKSAERTLRFVHLIPFPESARQHLPPANTAWRRREGISEVVGAPLSNARYRRVHAILTQLNELRRIAIAGLETDIAQHIGEVLQLFERDDKHLLLQRGRRRPIHFDEHGRTYSLGKRKESAARVWMIASRAAEGKVPYTTILVNNVPISKYFANAVDRQRIVRPFKLAGLLGAFNVFALVRGGGTTGQAGAIAHGIAKGLATHVPEVAIILRRAKLLRRDPRMVERKKTGLAKARKRYTWVKR